MTPPKCPRCGDNRGVYEEPNGWYCHVCKVVFDDTPDEGGDYSNDPTKRIEREEIYQERRRARRVRGDRRGDRGR